MFRFRLRKNSPAIDRPAGSRGDSAQCDQVASDASTLATQRDLDSPPVRVDAVDIGPAVDDAPIESVSLGVSVSMYPTGWNRALARAARCRVDGGRVALPQVRSLSIAIPRTKIAVRSFVFHQGQAGADLTSPVAEPAGNQASDTPDNSPRPTVSSTALVEMLARGQTRLQPPRDVIKLEDRLHYLLQPSLEAILAERRLEFPFLPFRYQMEGVAFLFPRHAAVLADEMGLGKTMQAITAIRLLLRCGQLRQVLLVCPKPLVTNWKREFTLWAPELPVMVIEGDQARRRWMWNLSHIPVKIANYELLHRDASVLVGYEADELDGAAAGGQAGIGFDLVVLDESQRIKNRSSVTSCIVRSISRRRSWALTGTPVENGTEDLVGIFEFLMPGYLPPDLKPRRMGETVADYVLRRTKDEVLSDLPPKLCRDAEVELTPEQRESYELAENEGVLRLNEMSGGVTIQHVFELVLRLKQICNFDPATGASAKLERLEADLEEIAQSGRKAIVFSQWVGTLEEIARRLQRFQPLAYHGKVPSRQRDDVIERFRREKKHSVLLMSYGAGSVGLNLQFASYVFLFDRWWNPAVEDQAINRAHRIGAAGPVTVTRFLTLDTIEQRIDAVLQQKRELFETIFSGHAGSSRIGLTQEEIFGLFDLRCAVATPSAEAKNPAA